MAARKPILGSSQGIPPPAQYTQVTPPVRNYSGTQAFAQGLGDLGAGLAQVAASQRRTAEIAEENQAREARVAVENDLNRDINDLVTNTMGWSSIGAKEREELLDPIREKYEATVGALRQKGGRVADAVSEGWAEAQWQQAAFPQLRQGAVVDNNNHSAWVASMEDEKTKRVIGAAGTPEDLARVFDQRMVEYDNAPNTYLNEGTKDSQKSRAYSAYYRVLDEWSRTGNGVSESAIEEAHREHRITQEQASQLRRNNASLAGINQSVARSNYNEIKGELRSGTMGLSEFLNHSALSAHLGSSKGDAQSDQREQRGLWVDAAIGQFAKSLNDMSWHHEDLTLLEARLDTPEGRAEYMEHVVRTGIHDGDTSLARPDSPFTTAEIDEVASEVGKKITTLKQGLVDGRSYEMFANVSEIERYNSVTPANDPSYLRGYVATMIAAQQSRGVPTEHIVPFPPAIVEEIKGTASDPSQFLPLMQRVLDPQSGVGGYAMQLPRMLTPDEIKDNPTLAGSLVVAGQMGVMNPSNNPNYGDAWKMMEEFSKIMEHERTGGFEALEKNFPGIRASANGSASVIHRLLDNISAATIDPERPRTGALEHWLEEGDIRVDTVDTLQTMRNIYSGIERTYNPQLRSAFAQLTQDYALYRGFKGGRRIESPAAAAVEGAASAMAMANTFFQVEQLNGTLTRGNEAVIAVTTPHVRPRESLEPPNEGAVTGGAVRAGMVNSQVLDAFTGYMRPLTMGKSVPNLRDGSLLSVVGAALDPLIPTAPEISRAWNLLWNNTRMARDFFGMESSDSLMPNLSSRMYNAHLADTVRELGMTPNYGTLTVGPGEGVPLVAEEINSRSLPARVREWVGRLPGGFDESTLADRQQIVLANGGRWQPSADGSVYRMYIDQDGSGAGVGARQRDLGPEQQVYHMFNGRRVPVEVPRAFVEAYGSFSEATSGTMGARFAAAFIGMLDRDAGGATTPTGNYDRKLKHVDTRLRIIAGEYWRDK